MGNAIVEHFNENLIREARAYCETVEQYGIMDSRSLKQYARLRNVHEGKPLEGKYKNV